MVEVQLIHKRAKEKFSVQDNEENVPNEVKVKVKPWKIRYSHQCGKVNAVALVYSIRFPAALLFLPLPLLTFLSN